MKKFANSKLALQTLAATIVTLLSVAGIVRAATTIGTNVNTEGTLTVTGASALNGNVTLGDTVADIITANGYLTQARIGTGSTFGHISTVGADELGVEGEMEVDGTAWFDGSLRASSTLMVTGAATLHNTLAVTGITTLTGALNFGTASSTAGGTALLKVPTINSDTGAISFGNENLTTTGAINFATASSTGLANLDSAAIGNGTTVDQFLFGTCTVNFGSITASSTAVTTCSATGVTTGHKVFLTPVLTDNQIIFTSASSTANNVIQVAAYNTGATVGAIDPASATWAWMAIK